MEPRYNLRKRPERPTTEVKKERQPKEKKQKPSTPEAKLKEAKESKESKEPKKPAPDVKPENKPKRPATGLKEGVQPEEKKARKFLQIAALFGGDNCGELGQGEIGITKINPTVVKIHESIQQVACGAMHTICLTDRGALYSFGCNDELALGRKTDGNEKLEAAPLPIILDEVVIKVTAGDSHSAALTKDNKVFVWGNFRDEHGSVGLTPSCDGKPCLKPIQMLPLIKIKDIASGSNHMLLADTSGKVYSFGVGDQGQLGRLTAEELAGSEGKPLEISTKNREKFLTPAVVNICDDSCDAVFAGNYSSFATNVDTKKNRTYGWGLNNYFQLGFKGQKDKTVQHMPKRSTFTCSTNIVNVACGQHHTLFLSNTGRVYSVGRHDYGMLGAGDLKAPLTNPKSIDGLSAARIVTISAGINTSFAVDKEGRIYSWGMNGPNLGQRSKGDDYDTKVPTEIKSKNLENKKVLSVSAGSSHTALIIE